MVLSLAAGPLAWTMDDPGFTPKPIFADLDRDGKPEQISWAKFATTEDEGDFYQVRVLDDDGSLIWEGPKTRDTENPFSFGAWHFGISIPEVAADIDGDGAVELVTPAPMSDVSPTCYRVLRWTGGRFVEAQSGCLLESPPGSGRFPWQKRDQWQGTWISSFKEVKPGGLLQVEVFEYREGSQPKVGEALVKGAPGGFQVTKWTKPVSSASEAPVGGGGGTAMPSGGGVVYRARLGSTDHFNSKGVRLTSPAEVLRQDRFNFHKGRGDAEDGGDPLFSTLAGRNTMDSRQLVAVDSDVASWSRAIVNGSPLVEVEVTPGALKVKIIQPGPGASVSPSAGGAQSLEDWFRGLSWFQKLSRKMPSGVSLMVFAEEKVNEEGLMEVDVRERHSPGSGYDPNVSPMVGMFGVTPDRKTVKWFNPVTGDYESTDAFFSNWNLR